MCREVGDDASRQTADRVPQRSTSWYEFQANCAIGALLLPQALVRQVAAPYLASDGVLGGTHLLKANRAHLVEELISVFDVNRPVARIRVEQMFPHEHAEQITL
jgi:hypothetical protein